MTPEEYYLNRAAEQMSEIHSYIAKIRTGEYVTEKAIFIRDKVISDLFGRFLTCMEIPNQKEAEYAG